MALLLSGVIIINDMDRVALSVAAGLLLIGAVVSMTMSRGRISVQHARGAAPAAA